MEVKKIIRISKQKLLLVTVLLTLLLISSKYTSLIPIVHAAEPNIQDKTMDVLNEVVGLNTEAYTTSLNSQLG